MTNRFSLHDDHDVKKIKLNLNHNLTNAVLEFDSHCLLIACRVFNVEIIFSPNVESCMFT